VELVSDNDEVHCHSKLEILKRSTLLLFHLGDSLIFIYNLGKGGAGEVTGASSWFPYEFTGEEPISELCYLQSMFVVFLTNTFGNWGNEPCG
jgi:hypothetical protein